MLNTVFSTLFFSTTFTTCVTPNCFILDFS